MAEIIINNAPKKYRWYLNFADKNSGPKGNDGKINTDLEAERAAGEWCNENPDECDTFLKYLEARGYSHLGFSKIYTRTKHENELIDEFIDILLKKPAYKESEEETAKQNLDAAIALSDLVDSDISVNARSKMVNPLIDAMLHNKDDQVRGAAAKALIKLTRSDIPSDLKFTIIHNFALKAKRGNKNAASAIQKFIVTNNSQDLNLRIVDDLIKLTVNEGWGSSVAPITRLLKELLDSDISPELKARINEAVK